MTYPRGAEQAQPPSQHPREKDMSTKKAFQFTPDSIGNELTDRIEQGWSNDRIVAAYGDDTGPNLRSWLNRQRTKIRKFWESMG